MHRLLFTTLLIGLAFVSSTAQKLTGTIIGTENSFDYTNNLCSTTVNTATNAFDGNLNSFFAGCERNNVWVGLDLGTPHIITDVAYCPRITQANRMVLGVFEGANNPDFGDAVPLFMITETPTENTITKKTINSSKAFRYVRYVGPNDSKGNVAEIEFYGYTSTGNNNQLYQATNLPMVVIHTTNAEDIIDKDVYLKGIISVISENGTNVYTDSLEIKGRGNASWSFPKKPYRIKLSNKANLLGLPAKAKDWTLINNYGDKTLMRNLLAFDLSKRFELTYTPAAKPVDVFLNGEYKGTYQLSDQIEVGGGRVDIDKMATTSITLPDLSGGYLVEIDAYAYEGVSWFSSAQRQIPVTIKYPKDDEIVNEQSYYIASHFNKLETALFANNYTDPIDGYRKYFDTNSFLRHFLVGEMSGNTDTYWSTYTYKLKNNDKFYFGPVWDFDIAYENDGRTYPINNNPQWIYASSGSAANGMREFVNRVLSDTGAYNELKDIYATYRNNGTITENSLIAVVDQYESEINQSQSLNFKRWPIMNEWVHMNPRIWGSYAAEVENVRNYIRNRILWMDNMLAYMPTDIKTNVSPNIHYWNNNGTLYIKGMSAHSQVMVYDIYGRILVNERANNEINIPLKNGVYIIHIVENSSVDSSFKCVIN